jgi:hypothetical protein
MTSEKSIAFFSKSPSVRKMPTNVDDFDESSSSEEEEAPVRKYAYKTEQVIIQNDSDSDISDDMF